MDTIARWAMYIIVGGGEVIIVVAILALAYMETQRAWRHNKNMGDVIKRDRNLR